MELRADESEIVCVDVIFEEQIDERIIAVHSARTEGPSGDMNVLIDNLRYVCDCEAPIIIVGDLNYPNIDGKSEDAS